jgi:uncharacterized repeat protein (TIGR01451 family)
MPFCVGSKIMKKIMKLREWQFFEGLGRLSFTLCLGFVAASAFASDTVTNWPTTGWLPLYGQDSFYSDVENDISNNGHEYLDFVGNSNYPAAFYMYRTAVDSGEAEDQLLFRLRVDWEKPKMSGAYQVFFETSYDASIDWVLELTTQNLDTEGWVQFGDAAGTNRSGVTYGTVVWSNNFTATTGYANWTGDPIVYPDPADKFNGSDDFFVEFGMPWQVFTNYTGITSTNSPFRLLIASSQSSGQIDDGDIGNSNGSLYPDPGFDDVYVDPDPDPGPFPQTLTFTNPGPQLVSDVVLLDADASSGLPVVYVISGPASLSTPSNLVFSAGGTVTVIATQPGDSDWFPATPITNSFTVTAPNSAPVSTNDIYSVTEDVALNIPAAGVLANDYDADGDSLSAIWFSGPSNGSLTLNADGSFTYTPTNDYTGADSFTYGASDGLLTGAVATVSLSVTNINDAPVLGLDEFPAVEDTPLDLPVLDNDGDVDGDPLTISSVTDTNVTIIGGTNLVYIPPADFNGTNTFTYIVDDGNGGSVTGSVTVTVGAVNDDPTLNGESGSTAEDTPLTVDVLANDSDVDGDNLTLLAGPVASNGTATVSGDEITFTPDADFNGTGTVTYYVTDGTVTNSAQLVVTVTIDVLANDSDPDGDGLTLISATASNGTVSVSGSDITFTPSTNFNGSASVTYYVTDGAVTNSARIDLTVDPVNDVPVAQADSYGVDEDGTLNIAAPGVLGNDDDVEGDSLSAILFSDVTNGTFSLNLDGSFTYMPDADYEGADSFSYYAVDGFATSAVSSVTISVNGIPDAPSVGYDDVDTDEDTPVTIDAIANDSDPDGDLISIVDVLATNVVIVGGTNLVYNPPMNYNGTNTFEYVVEDSGGLASTCTVTVVVNPVNDAPNGAADVASTYEETDVTIPVLANDSDVEGDVLSLTDAFSSNGLVQVSGTNVVFTPAMNFTGNATVTYLVSDGDLMSTGTVSVAVLAAADLAMVLQGPGEALVGMDLEYTISLTNMGPSTASNVVVQGYVPTNLIFSAVSAGGIYTNGMVVWPVVDALPEGGVLTRTFTSSALSPGIFTNQVEAGSTTFDPDLSNNDLSVTGARTMTRVYVAQFSIEGGEAVVNSQTGLLEQEVNVTNTTAIAVPGFMIMVHDLPDDVEMWNATGMTNGVPYVRIDAPLDPNDHMLIRLEYYRPSRQSFTNRLEVQWIYPEDVMGDATGAAAITDWFMDERNGADRFVIEFETVPGATYRVLYKDNLKDAEWRAAVPDVKAGSSKLQWYDDGPPKTRSLPPIGRNYTVIRTDEAGE